jgi:hypothetical protein
MPNRSVRLPDRETVTPAAGGKLMSACTTAHIAKLPSAQTTQHPKAQQPISSLALTGKIPFGVLVGRSNARRGKSPFEQLGRRPSAHQPKRLDGHMSDGASGRLGLRAIGLVPGVACGSALTSCRSSADMGGHSGDHRREIAHKSQQAPVAKREPAENLGPCRANPQSLHSHAMPSGVKRKRQLSPRESFAWTLDRGPTGTVTDGIRVTARHQCAPAGCCPRSAQRRRGDALGRLLGAIPHGAGQAGTNLPGRPDRARRACGVGAVGFADSRRARHPGGSGLHRAARDARLTLPQDGVRAAPKAGALAVRGGLLCDVREGQPDRAREAPLGSPSHDSASPAATRQKRTLTLGFDFWRAAEAGTRRRAGGCAEPVAVGGHGRVLAHQCKRNQEDE